MASRRKADELIKSGRVEVNGQTGQLNTDVSEKDIVKLNGRLIFTQKKHYILLYKPAGYITTLNDPQARPKILDLLSIPERIVPIGRLDYDTTGALLMTNDGQLAHRLMHPSFGVDKVYEAEVKGVATETKLIRLRKGVKLDDGISAPAKVRLLSENKIEITIHEGRNHQVKRMLAAVGLPVIKLHRSVYGGINLSGLEPGEWRNLTPTELKMLE